jgi:hypothetical protein
MKPVRVSIVILMCWHLVVASSALQNESPSSPVSTDSRSSSAFLPRPLSDVVKLKETDISDDVILAYIESARVPFSPTADQILALHEKGISDRLLTAMIKHRPAQPAAAASYAPSPAPPAQTATRIIVQAPPPVYVQPAPVYVAPPPVYVTQPFYYNPPVYFSFGFRHHHPFPFWRHSFHFGHSHRFWHSHFHHRHHFGHGRILYDRFNRPVFGRPSFHGAFVRR